MRHTTKAKLGGYAFDQNELINQICEVTGPLSLCIGVGNKIILFSLASYSVTRVLKGHITSVG
jgi:hypothetical protein